MGQLGELISAINSTIGNEEIGKLVDSDAVKAIEIDDDILTQAKDSLVGLMTMDAAKNNTTIQEHVRNQIKPAMRRDLLGAIDTEILSTARELFGDEKTSELNGIDRTNERVKKFAEFTKQSMTSKVDDKKLKEINTGLQNQINELNANHAKELEQREGELQKTQQGFTDKLIKNKFNSVLSSYTFGEKYQDDFIKNALIDDVYKKVTKTAKLTLADDGSIIPKNAEDPKLDIYVNNKQVTELKELIDPLVKDYTKKSNPISSPGDPADYKPAKETKISSLAQDLLSRRERDI